MTTPIIDVANSMRTVMNTIPGVKIRDVLDGRRKSMGTASRGSG